MAVEGGGVSALFYRGVITPGDAASWHSPGVLQDGGTGGGAPADADYLVKTANGSLSAERVVTDTATVTWDWSVAGQAKANSAGGGLEVVTSDRTYYVRTNGSNSNTGLVNTAGGAFLTIQHAVDVVTQTLHMKRCIVTIDGNGFTYDESVYLSTVLGDGGEEYIVVLKNAVLAPTFADDAVVYVDGSFGLWQLEDLTIDAATGGSPFCIYVAGSNIFMTGTINLYVSPGAYFIGLFYRGYINTFFIDLNLFGTSCNYVFWIDNNSYFETISMTTTVENALTCNLAFIAVLDNSIANFGIVGTGSTFIGSATGPRFQIDGGEVNTPDNAGGPTYFPGDVAGTITQSGFYDGAEGIRQKAGAVVVGDLPVGTSQVIQDSSNNTLRAYVNDAGTLKVISGPDKARVSSQFDKTADTTLANITGLSVYLSAGRTYSFEAVLFTSSNVLGGVKAAIAGTATATAIIYEGETTAAAAIGAQTRATALATSVGGITAVSAARINIIGTITVNAAGTLTVQFAQNASNGAASSVLVGSYFVVYDIV